MSDEKNKGNFSSETIAAEEVEIELAGVKGHEGFIVSRERGRDYESLGEHEVIAELRKRKLVTSPSDGVDHYEPAAEAIVAKAREVFGTARTMGMFGPVSVTLVVGDENES
jgi:hypothetical protein